MLSELKGNIIVCGIEAGDTEKENPLSQHIISQYHHMYFNTVNIPGNQMVSGLNNQTEMSEPVNYILNKSRNFITWMQSCVIIA